MLGMIRNTNIVARKVHNCFFLINIKDDYADEKCTLYEINEIGYFIWNKLDQCSNLQQIVECIVAEISDEFDVDEITNDVQLFIDSLAEIGFIRFE